MCRVKFALILKSVFVVILVLLYSWLKPWLLKLTCTHATKRHGGRREIMKGVKGLLSGGKSNGTEFVSCTLYLKRNFSKTNFRKIICFIKWSRKRTYQKKIFK